MPLNEKTDSYDFAPDVEYWLPDHLPKDVDPSFYELFETTMSRAHYHHILQIAQRWTREREEFMAAGNLAGMAVMLVEAMEAALLALLLAGLIASARHEQRTSRQPDQASHA